MKRLIEQYLRDYSDIYIDHYNIDGAVCSVTFYTDESQHYRETTNINIWDMLLFLTDKHGDTDAGK